MHHKTKESAMAIIDDLRLSSYEIEIVLEAGTEFDDGRSKANQYMSKLVKRLENTELSTKVKRLEKSWKQVDKILNDLHHKYFQFAEDVEMFHALFYED